MNRTYKKRLIIGGILIGILALVHYFNVGRYITLEAIKENRALLQQMIERNYVLFVAGYLGIYVLTTMFSLPVSAVLSIAGGFFFGTFFGALYSTIGATIGSTISFLLIRHLFGKVLQDRYKNRLRTFNKEFKRHGYSYLLMIHFIVVIPLVVANVLAGLANVTLWTFVWTTAVGMIPGTLVYAFAGQQLMSIEKFRDIFSHNMIFALIFIFLLGFIPFIIRYFKKDKRKIVMPGGE